MLFSESRIEAYTNWARPPGAASQWWVNSKGRFCIDTGGQVWCGNDYYLQKNRLKIFTFDGRMVQEFKVKR